MDNTLSPDEQIAMAGRFRQAKTGSGEGDAAEEAGGDGQPKSLREKVMAARRAMDIKQRAKDKIKEKVAAPIKMGTDRALQWAWTVLIPSFGLSLIYINTHVFLRWIFPSAFCKLGEEWMPKTVSEHSSKNIAGTAFGIVEVMGLVLLDLMAFFILFAIAAILVWLADNIVFNAVLKVYEFVAGAFD